MTARRTLILFLLAAVLISLAFQPVSALKVESVTVKPAKQGVIVKVNYSLDPLTALRVFLFGAKSIENDVLSLFNSTNYTVLRIGYNQAELLFPASKIGNVTYFCGVNLSAPVNVTVLAGTPLNIGNTKRIPPIFFCETSLSG